jgi:hypothetical protein
MDITKMLLQRAAEGRAAFVQSTGIPVPASVIAGPTPRVSFYDRLRAGEKIKKAEILEFLQQIIEKHTTDTDSDEDDD